jgi:hypothetical protein
MKTWASIASAETPENEPRAHASGPDPDRILLFGSDMLVGRGVLSHDVALPGYLARKIATETHRGVDIHIEAHAKLTLAHAVIEARKLELELDRYDAVIINLGLADAFSETSARNWAATLEVLLHVLISETSVSAQVFVVGLPDPTVMPAFNSKHGHRLAEIYDGYNHASEAVVAGQERVTFLPFCVKEEQTGGRFHTAKSFEGYATTLAPALIAHLEAEFTSGAPRSEPISSEEHRQASLNALRILDTAPEERFDRIVTQAQRAFGTEYAAFNIIDNERRWSKSFVGPTSQEGERRYEMCNTTIHTHSGLIVPDAQHDPRFADNPFVAGDPKVRFYAGYPIEAPDGQRVGALCVYDTNPRILVGREEATLRDLALKIERELWTMPPMKASVPKG